MEIEIERCIVYRSPPCQSETGIRERENRKRKKMIYNRGLIPVTSKPIRNRKQEKKKKGKRRRKKGT